MITATCGDDGAREDVKVNIDGKNIGIKEKKKTANQIIAGPGEGPERDGDK